MNSRLVLITGASSGIGAATAMLYGGLGRHVLLLARNAGRLEAVAAAIRETGGTATPVAANLADAAATSEAAARITCDFGTPDILINNAGIGRWLTLAETSSEEARETIAVPYLAAFDLTRAFLPGMIARRSGNIVCVTSPAAYLAWPNASAYIAARRAVAGLAEALQSELKGTGISVTLAVLGNVDTPYWEHNPGSLGNVPRANPRLLPTLTPDEAARAIYGGVERKSLFVVKPGLYRALFVLNALFPRLVASQIRRASKSARART
ncbi:MAG: SDR family NAD(P)-dependent oxidoreductase [Methyloceanibacter sp.]